MSDGRPDDELPTFGRVVARQCHELVNVLNIVNEMSGLQEDLLPRARQGDAAALDQLGGLAARIQEQVKRGRAIIRNLQHVAHGAAAGGVDPGGAGGEG
ncbi:MAG TPA: hypothetical protein VGQ83_30720 [Polyangia bacterium]